MIVTNVGFLEKDKNETIALEYFIKACDGELGIGCFNLAKYHKKKKNLQASYLFGKSYIQGFGKGCLETGKIALQEGNKKKAAHAFKGACSRGIREAGARKS